MASYWHAGPSLKSGRVLSWWWVDENGTLVIFFGGLMLIGMAIMMMSRWKWNSRDVFWGGGVASIKMAIMMMSWWKWNSRDFFWGGGVASIKKAIIMMMSRWKWNSRDILVIFSEGEAWRRSKRLSWWWVDQNGTLVIFFGGLTLIGMAIMMMSRWKNHDDE